MPCVLRNTWRVWKYDSFLWMRVLFGPVSVTKLSGFSQCLTTAIVEMWSLILWSSAPSAGSSNRLFNSLVFNTGSIHYQKVLFHETALGSCELTSSIWKVNDAESLGSGQILYSYHPGAIKEARLPRRQEAILNWWYQAWYLVIQFFGQTSC